MLLFRRQGADGTRVFTFSSVLGPAKAKRCHAGPRPALPPKLSSEISDRFPVHMPRPQPIEQRGHCEPHNRSPPQEIRWVQTANVCPPQRKKRCDGQNAETC